MNTTFYLLTPKSYLAQFRHEEDRVRMASPVAVELSHSDASDRLLWVREGDKTYPVLAANLKRAWQLTNRQRRQAGIEKEPLKYFPGLPIGRS